MTYTDQIFIELLAFVAWAKWLFIVAFVLTIADLKFGLAASRHKKEEIKRSRAIRRTIDKICSYLLWVIIAYSLGKAFGNPFGIDLLPLIILLVIYGVELESIYVNYFICKGKNVRVNIFKFFSKKTDIIDVEEIKEEEKKNENNS